jgi:hypothetical protein
MLNGVSAKMKRLNFSLPQVMDRFATEKLTAHLVMGFSLLFEKHHITAGCGKTHGDHRACQAASDHQVFY